MAAETAGSGPVEREARQLVEAAARWLSAVPDNDGYAARTGDPVTDGAAPVGSATGEDTAQGSQEHLCRGCPWCRAKAAAGPLGADTLESLAQLLGAAAESLSLFAQSRREETQAEPAEEVVAEEDAVERES